MKNDTRKFLIYKHVYTRVLPLKLRTLGCVHNPNPFGVFLDMDPTHLTPSLLYALRSLGFDLSLPL